MLAQHAIAVRVLDQSDAADCGFRGAAFYPDQVNCIAVVIFVVEFGRAAFDGDLPVENRLAPRILGPQAHLLKTIGYRRIVAVARLVLDPQPHAVTSNE